jgi:hypothetical protein
MDGYGTTAHRHLVADGNDPSRMYGNTHILATHRYGRDHDDDSVRPTDRPNGTTTVATFSNLNKAAGYQLRTFNVSAFAGQTVTLKFTGTEDSSLQTSFVVDDTAITLS